MEPADEWAVQPQFVPRRAANRSRAVLVAASLTAFTGIVVSIGLDLSSRIGETVTQDGPGGSRVVTFTNAS